MAYEIVGTDVVGDVADELLSGYGEEIIGAARRAKVIKQQPGKLQRLPLGIGITSVGAGLAAVITVTPQIPFKLERFISQSTGFSVSDIKVGVKSQFVGSGSIPIEVFARDVTGFELKGDTAVPGVDIALFATNITAGTLTVSGTYVGLAID